SVGQEDHAPAVLAADGELACHGVALKPGGPVGFGSLRGRLVFLLPGNPVSCLVAYDLFAGRALRRMVGRSSELPYFSVTLPKADGSVSAVFSDNLEPDREELLDKIKHATFAVQAGDKMEKLKATKDGDVLKISGAGKGPGWVHGVCPYGVLEKGKEPFLLTY